MTENAHGHNSSDALQLLLDGRLDAGERAKLEAHVATCARCRRELDALRQVKTVMREKLLEHPEPPELTARIASALASASRAKPAPARSRMRWAAIIALSLAAVATLVVVLGRDRRPDFVTAAATDLANYRAGRLELELRTSDPQVLQQQLAARDLPFVARVFDFGMMGYRLEGGGAHALAHRVGALFAYAGPKGEHVVCQMYPGSTTELPAPVEEREHNGIRFLIYRTTTATVVFWQEGAVVCVLAADGDPEAAIQLAYAKAMKPPASA